MQNNQEKDALDLGEILKENGPAPADISSAPSELAPYLRMARGLGIHAKEEAPGMDPAVMETQKEHLLQMAKNLKSSSMSSANQHQSAPPSDNQGKSPAPKRKPWFIWIGAGALVTAVVMLMLVTKSGPLNFPSADKAAMSGKAVLSLVIPAAYAGDAFNVTVDKGSAEQADLDTTFRVESKVDVDPDDLAQSLRIVPAAATDDSSIEVDVKKINAGVYSVTPKQALAPGEVYRVTIAAAVKEDSGATRDREFSWAIQTNDIFRVLQSVPGNGSSNVPLDTSIEVTWSKTGWVDPAQFVDITPATKGRFEGHGRNLVFIPEKPLVPGTVYSVVYKKGFGLKDGPVLGTDQIIKFETQSASPPKNWESYFDIYQDNLESSLDAEAVIYVSASDDYLGKKISVTGYSLTMDQAATALKEMQAVPEWAEYNRTKRTALSQRAVNQTFSMEVDVESGEGSWQKLIRLPADIARGWYVVKIQAGAGAPNWLLLQKTDVAAYSMVANNKTLVWVVNRGSSKPMGSLPVTLDDKSQSTGADGVAQFETPAIWRDSLASPSDASPSSLLKIGTADSGLLLVAARPIYYYDYSGNVNQFAGMDYWSFLYQDRPLYHPDDELKFFGMVKPRSGTTAPQNIAVELRSNALDYGSYSPRVIRRQAVTPDAGGYFLSSMSWSALAPGYYNLTTLVNNEVVQSRQVEIRAFIKPAYYLEIELDKKYVFAGDTVSGRVKASFFDGTPYSGLDVNLHLGNYENISENYALKTADDGYASFSYKTSVLPCTSDIEYSSCLDTVGINMEAKPASGEETDIYATSWASVLRSRVGFDAWHDWSSNKNGRVDFKVYQVLDEALERGEDGHGQGISGREISADVYRVRWNKIEDGTWYDAIEKKVHPRYRYERQYDKIDTKKSTTDASGLAALEVAMEPDTQYIVMAKFEENGISHIQNVYLYDGWYFNAYTDGSISLISDKANPMNSGYALGESVSLRLVRDNELLTEDESSYLFVRASRGIKSAVNTDKPTYSFNYGDEDVPNATVYGIAYLPQGFVETSYQASLSGDAYTLKLDFTLDKNNFAPGEEVGFNLKVTDHKGNPVSGARVVVTSIDESLLAISNSATPDTMLQIYRYVPDGIITSVFSHKSDLAMGYGGAERGGGGGMMDAPRSDFKDTAAFLALTTDGSGNARSSFKAPDNLTAWHLFAAALTDDMRGGQGEIKAFVTKPLFVEAVIPSNLVTGDKPVLKLRAHGSSLPKTGDVVYTVRIKSLGVDDQKVQGPVGTPVYLALDELVPGRHEIVIGVQSGTVSDAIKRFIDIADSRGTHLERAITELGPGVTLPDPGESRLVMVTFEGKNRAAKRMQVEALARPWSARVEARTAAVLSRNLLADSFGSTETFSDDLNLMSYQQSDGGIGILPYTSSEAMLSSKLAAAAPGSFDRINLANYFWKILDDKGSTREQSIGAISGLASLGQPVLAEIRQAQALADLTWREKLMLMRGLVAMGDREGARSMLDGLLQSAKDQDGQMFLAVGDDVAEEMNATAEAAALAAELAHPSAEKLMARIESNWANESFTVLDRAMYLARVVPNLTSQPAKFSFAIGDKVESVDLDKNPWFSLELSAEDIAGFRATSVEGPVVASFLKLSEGDAKNNSDVVAIGRSYVNRTDAKRTTFREGDMVEVNLNVAWKDRSPDGCYMVHDRLPGGLLPVIRYMPYLYVHDNWYPTESSAGEVSFVVCKGYGAIKYTARVANRGSYQATSATVQSMDVPAIASKSEPYNLVVE